MFRSELGGPVNSRSGFFDFVDIDLLPLLEVQQKAARLIAHHVIAPALSPDDKTAFQEVKDRTTKASEVAGSEYKNRIIKARQLGCTTTRLQVVQGNRFTTPVDGDLLTWQHDICLAAHAETSEGVKVAWLGEQYEPLTTALALGEGPELFREFMRGIKQDYPIGGHWTIYQGLDMKNPLLVAEVMYGRDGDKVKFEGFDIYKPEQLTPETQRYIGFWSDVHASDQASITLHNMIPID